MAKASIVGRPSSRNPVRIGERFGRLLIVGEGGWATNRSGVRTRLVAVRCDCGTEKIMKPGPLRPGIVVSCGCKARENAKALGATANLKHGDCKVGKRAPEYGVYRTMLSRCYNPNVERYPIYGGRGITVCERWRGEGGYTNFRADMGPRPHGHSIERQNSDGNYEPGNCRWATASEQSNNTSRNRVLTMHGKTQNLCEWAREIGIRPITIHQRLKAGWPIEIALTKPLRGKG